MRNLLKLAAVAAAAALAAGTAAFGQTADLNAVNGRGFTARVGAPMTQAFDV